jgi:DMSO/TMAO reductase YedYZ molybdopterin-dependent catalytic subunit
MSGAPRNEQHHSIAVRVTHWLMALAILAMIGSGWWIYNASPIFGFSFPDAITLGGDVDTSLARHNDPGVASALAWHFAGMWVLAGSYLLFVLWGAWSGHFWRDFLPVGPRAFIRDFIAAATFRLEHRLGSYNAVQKAFYWGCTGVGRADDHFRHRDLEAGADLPSGSPVRRFPGRPDRAFHWHEWHRGIPARACRARRAGAEDLARDGPWPCIRDGAFLASGGCRMSDDPFNLERRRVVRGGLSLGALTLLTGCDISDHDQVQRVLARFSQWNDQIQAALFSSQRLAPTFPEDMAVKDFRYNAWYEAKRAPQLEAADYRLDLAGMIADRRPWSVEQLHALPQISQVTRHICVEGWSMIGKWTGTPLSTFLQRIGADTTAKFVGFECADGYYEGIDMPTALHPQTIMAFSLSDQTLPAKYGFPFKIRIPTKLGFKNPKFVTTLFVTNKQPRGFWTDRGYNWFSGI